jgi:hypothetical protein
MSDTARGLYVDPTPAFQPSLDFISGQRTQANERYAQNKADIANIFGNLTQVNRESQARVNEQFTRSIADQQMQTAERAAQARLGQQQTQQAAIRAMDERGGGPMGNLLASPVALEAERGIGDMNAYQQIWAGQQGAIRGQTEQDLMAAQRGLGYQQVQANQGLQRSLEDVLMGLSGQEAGIRGDLAGAIIGQQGRVTEANYNEIMTERAAEEARRVAAIRGAYNVRQAEITAQNKLDLEALKQAGEVPSYAQDITGAASFLKNEGRSGAQIGNFITSLERVDLSQARNSAEAYALWLQANVPAGAKAKQQSAISDAEKVAARMYLDGLRYTGAVQDSLLPNQGRLPN